MRLRGIAGFVPAGVVLCCLLASAASAAEANSAATFIRSFSDEAIAKLADNALDERTRKREFKSLLHAGFDLKTIGRFVLGRYWRRTTTEEREEFQELFGQFVVKAYYARLGQYASETLHIGDSRTVGTRDTIVSSEIRTPNAPTVRIDWRVRERAGEHKVIDVIVEGLSMAITQRDEFSAVIQRSGGRVEGLIEQMRAKLEDSN